MRLAPAKQFIGESWWALQNQAALRGVRAALLLRYVILTANSRELSFPELAVGHFLGHV
jgi:hypothetical protein